ncbi:MAG: metal ABC transporter substrate-binding protein [Methyloceanibacter sp.]|nr:metal ABC transporter substrate-binding protein [Methyloceanibacter sp.]
MKHRVLMQIGLALILLFGLAGSAEAADKVKAVASFSILGDMIGQVGGDRVEVVTLVGPDGDAHVFSPTPADAKTLAGADVFFVNGLGFEGWLQRLEKASGFKGRLVTASDGVKPLTMEDEGHYHDGEEHAEHADHAKGHDDDEDDEEDEEEEVPDPHAWQDLANGKIYVANIRDGLIEADPEGRAVYETNVAKYLEAIAKEAAAVRAALSALPEARRKIITSHDAFNYFGKAYGLEIIAPEGVSTESEASAQDVAKIIRQIKADKIPAVFVENIADRRLLDQIARETGAKIGGTLYSDALSGHDGPAPTYLDMFRHNVGALTAALSS